MPDYNYYQAPQQPYDFSPITQGAQTAAQIQAQAYGQAAANILQGIQHGRELRARKKEADTQRTFADKQNALERLGQQSLRTLADEAASKREVARQKNAYDVQEQADAAAMEREKLRNENSLKERELVNQGYAQTAEINRNAMEQAQIDKENRARAEEQRMAALKAKATTGIYHALAEPDGPYNPFVDVTIDPFASTGMTEDDIKAALMSRGIPEPDAKLRAKELAKPKKVKIIDPTKMAALRTRLGNDVDPVAGPEALDEMMKAKWYNAPTMDEAFQRQGDELDKQLGRIPSRFPQDKTPEPQTIGHAGKQPRPISQATPDDQQYLLGKAIAAAQHSPEIAGLIKKIVDAGGTLETAPPEVQKMIGGAISTYVRDHMEQIAREHNWVIDTPLFPQEQQAPAAGGEQGKETDEQRLARLKKAAGGG